MKKQKKIINWHL